MSKLYLNKRIGYGGESTFAIDGDVYRVSWRSRSPNAWNHHAKDVFYVTIGLGADPAGTSFESELLTDQRALLEEVAQDFWARELYAAPDLLARHVSAARVTPTSLAELAGRICARPDMRVVPMRPDIPDLDSRQRAWKQAFAPVRTMWVARGHEVIDQLARYRVLLEAEYPQFTRHYVLLSPEGNHADSEDERPYWTPISYDNICRIVERVIKIKASTLSGEVQVFMGHYATMLRRHILQDSNIHQLARRIYEKHREAVELIYEHRPDNMSQVREIAELKMKDLNAHDMDAACRMIAGSARSMGIEVVE